MALLAVAVFGIFFKVTLGQHTFFFRDFGALGYPYSVLLRDSLLAGELPLWNPYSHCGVPFMAQMGTWYPPGLLALLLPIPWSVNVLMLAHLVLGGGGMYWLSRRWGCGGFASSVAGFAFVFSGLTFSCMAWGNYIASLAWMPWLAGVVPEAWRKGGGDKIAIAALLSALQVLTATPEITMIFWLFLGVLAITKIWGGNVKFSAVAKRLGAIVLLTAGLVMIQMLPFFDLLSNSQRDVAAAESSHWAMPGWGLVNLFVPLFHTYRGPQGQWFQPGQEFLISYYLSAAVMVFAAVGLLARRSRWFVVLGVMALFCWILALGKNGYLYDGIKRIFPWISIARFPVKYAVLTAFFVPLLAAWGVQQMERDSLRARRIMIVATACVLLAIGIFVLLGKRHPFQDDDWNAMALNALVRALLLGAVVAGVWLQGRAMSKSIRITIQLGVLLVFPIDAFTHNPRLVPTIPSSNLASGVWEASGNPPAPKPGEGRIMISPQAERLLNFSRVPDFAMDFTGKRLAQWYNLNIVDRIPKVSGAVTLRPAHFDIIERGIYYSRQLPPGEPFYDFMGVQFVSATNNPVEWVRRPSAMPLITAGQLPIFADTEDTWGEIKSPDFKPRERVVLPLAAKSLVSVTNRGGCVISNVVFTANRVSFETSADKPSLVVLAQTYYHRWEVSVDGQPAMLFRANLAFQALEVPGGNHRVELVYRDPALRAGAAVSIASLIACGLLWKRSRRLEATLEPSEICK